MLNLKKSGWAFLFNALVSSLSKGVMVLYSLLLPILYAEGKISAADIGFIGALLIVGVFAGAIGVTTVLHRVRKLTLLIVSVLLSISAGVLVLLSPVIVLLLIAYPILGLADGILISTINAVTADLTTQGKRYGALASISMLTDFVRIILPICAAALYVVMGISGYLYLPFAVLVVLSTSIFLLTRTHAVDGEVSDESEDIPQESIRHNRPFLFVMLIEFLDSFASSQLYVFLPVLFLAKGFTIENALVMQSIIFAGYLVGRWVISLLAVRLSGYTAVAIAEIGMVVSIGLLLITPSSALLYVLCFLLGIFTRGTSPAIKAMAFDYLTPSQMRRGSAVHVISGDSGSAIAQLLFGLLLAWVGVTAPFVAAIICGLIVVILCVTTRAVAIK